MSNYLERLQRVRLAEHDKAEAEKQAQQKRSERLMQEAGVRKQDELNRRKELAHEAAGIVGPWPVLEELKNVWGMGVVEDISKDATASFRLVVRDADKFENFRFVTQRKFGFYRKDTGKTYTYGSIPKLTPLTTIPITKRALGFHRQTDKQYFDDIRDTSTRITLTTEGNLDSPHIWISVSDSHATLKPIYESDEQALGIRPHLYYPLANTIDHRASIMLPFPLIQDYGRAFVDAAILGSLRYRMDHHTMPADLLAK